MEKKYSNMWSWCGEVDVSKSHSGGGAGVPGVPPPRICAPLFGKPASTRFQNFSRPAFSFFVIHAPSCARPRHGSGPLENDKCDGDASSRELAAQRRREVDTTTLVNVTQGDPRPSPAAI